MCLMLLNIFLEIEYCSPNPCQNGGTCKDGNNNYTCFCAAGYSGVNCTFGKSGHFCSSEPLGRNSPLYSSIQERLYHSLCICVLRVFYVFYLAIVCAYR